MKRKTVLFALLSLILVLLTPSLSAIEYSTVTEVIEDQYLAPLQYEKDYLGLNLSLSFRLVLSIFFLLLSESIITLTYVIELLVMNYVMLQIPLFSTNIGQVIIGVLLAFVSKIVGDFIFTVYESWTDNCFQDFPKVGDFLYTLMVLCSMPAVWVGYRIVIPR